jgi:hypothetical protein
LVDRDIKFTGKKLYGGGGGGGGGLRKRRECGDVEAM